MSAGVGAPNAWVQTWHSLVSGTRPIMPVELALALNHGRRTAPLPQPGFEKSDWAFHQSVVDDVTLISVRQDRPHRLHLQTGTEQPGLH